LLICTLIAHGHFPFLLRWILLVLSSFNLGLIMIMQSA
jgi:hypothetical protein